MRIKRFNNKNGLTSKLRRYLQEFFREKRINSFYFTAPNDAKSPFVVWHLRPIQSLDDGDYGKKFYLEINAYSINEELVLENLLDFLEDEITQLNESNQYFSISGNLGYGRVDFEEDSPLVHKRTTLELRVFKTGECL